MDQSVSYSSNSTKKGGRDGDFNLEKEKEVDFVGFQHAGFTSQHTLEKLHDNTIVNRRRTVFFFICMCLWFPYFRCVNQFNNLMIELFRRFTCLSSHQNDHN
jgi:hypothetical protein